MTVLKHVAIIMDGNGRWAKARGLPRIAGHRAGTENLRAIIRASVEFGISHLTLYAFSTENWSRSREEVSGLMQILAEALDRELNELHKEGVQIRHLGDIERLDPALQKKIVSAIEKTKNNDRLVLSVALNYGGRAEIIHAVRAMMRDGCNPDEVDEGMISRYLYTVGLPDPDLVIRTSGEMRTSNFLIWQAVYAEWYITPTYWPDFGREELKKAIDSFHARERRFGGVLG